MNKYNIFLIFLNIVFIVICLVGLGINVYRYGDHMLYPVVYTTLIVYYTINIIKIKKDGRE